MPRPGNSPRPVGRQDPTRGGSCPTPLARSATETAGHKRCSPTVAKRFATHQLTFERALRASSPDPRSHDNVGPAEDCLPLSPVLEAARLNPARDGRARATRGSGNSFAHRRRAPGSNRLARMPRVPTALQGSFENGHRGGNHNRGEGDEDAHENTPRAIITIAKHDEGFSYRDKTDKRNRTIPDGSQRLDGRW